MEAVANRPRWKIIQFSVNESNQIIRIDGKLPAHLTECTGVYFSVKTQLDTLETEIAEIGEISLLFNARKSHPIHDTIGFSKVPTGTRPVFKKMAAKLLPNQPITGFYLDYGKTTNRFGNFLPYTINIYFECKTAEPVKNG
ncbi:MAG: hypothetical protein KKA07_07670 [Bacteroidetes bacterium]|nr:hypothetical protein [Bacteroidota bacterium]MBU1718940.1 hypothetical protein [Bacteroidota bacterium]